MSKLILDQLEQGVGQSLRSVPIPVLATVLRKREPSSTGRLLKDVADMVFSEGTRFDEDTCVVIARILVASLPGSLNTIAQVLTTFSGPQFYELQFSVFCFLADHPQVQGDHRLRHQLLHQVEHYLASVRASTGDAAWMAGDLLGDHWPLDESVPVLTVLADTARYVAGREGALHGLAHALERAPKQTQWDIMAALQRVVERDRSTAVREYAAQIMGALRGV